MLSSSSNILDQRPDKFSWTISNSGLFFLVMKSSQLKRCHGFFLAIATEEESVPLGAAPGQREHQITGLLEFYQGNNVGPGKLRVFLYGKKKIPFL